MENKYKWHALLWASVLLCYLLAEVETLGTRLFLSTLFLFTVAHEAIHIYTAKRFNIKTELKPKWYGLYVKMKGYSGCPRKAWKPWKKKRYDWIAISPYLLFVPLFWTATFLLAGHIHTAGGSNVTMILFSNVFAFAVIQGVTFPFEWVVS